MLTLEKIKAIFCDHDVEGFIDIGAPDDEYDSEAKRIFAEIQNLGTVLLTEESLMKIVCSEWERNFNLDEDDLSKRVPNLRRVVLDILKAN